MKAKEFRKKAEEDRRKVASRKSKAEKSDSSEEIEEDDEEDLLVPQTQEVEGPGEDEIKLDFRFCDSRGEDDEMWIRTLISQGFSGKAVLQTDDTRIRRLSAAVAEQINIGTFVKPDEEGEDSIYAFMTVLNARDHLPPNLVNLLPSVGKVGWVIRERILNMPDDVTVPLFTCLKEDLDFASKEDNEEFDMFLLLAPCFETNDGSEAIEEDTRKKKKKKQRMNKEAAVEYALFEDAVFATEAQAPLNVFRFPRPEVAEGVDVMPETAQPFAAQLLLLTKSSFLQALNSLSNI